MGTVAFIDPIPGGCNLVFQNEVSPYLKVHGSNYFFSVEFQPPSIEGHMCEANAVEAEMYYYYLTPWDFSEATYFEGLNNMITVENILKYGNKVINNKWKIIQTNMYLWK